MRNALVKHLIVAAPNSQPTLNLGVILEFADEFLRRRLKSRFRSPTTARARFKGSRGTQLEPN